MNPLEGDSETEELEDAFMGNTTSTFFPANQTATTSFQQQPSRRAAPVMGNRGLETQRISQERSQERSRTKTKMGQASKDNSRSRGSPRTSRKASQEDGSSQIAHLDERNLKRAVNRYGTMPKGARIGAYLESLRQSGMTPEPVTEQGVESDSVVDNGAHTSESMDRSMVGKPSKTAQMLRSNSSHGGFSPGIANNGVTKSPSNNQVRRVQQGSLERSFGPASSHQPSTQPPEFDFPPPPADLPPPSPSPRTGRKFSSDKENLPERLERNSKVTRFREVSSDSCESLGPTNQIKSPMSPVSENRTLGSPAVGSLSSPGSTLDHEYKRSTIPPAPPAKSEDAIKPFMNEKVQRNMESQLLNEMSQQEKLMAASMETSGGASNTPADMLVSELFESFKAKSSKPTPKSLTESHPTYENAEAKQEIDFKANLRKVKKTIEDEPLGAKANASPAPPIDFKSNLKKTSDPSVGSPITTKPLEPESGNIVDFKAKLRKSAKPETQTPSKEDSSTEPVDFKARLRKVSDPKDKSSISPTKEVNTIEPKVSLDKRESIGSTEGTDDIDDKRKSTGSISSLRKMWESSPKPSRATQPPTDLDKVASTPPDETGEKTQVKFEKRVWPPVPNSESEKPVVPVKPTVKPPAPTTKPPPPKEPLVKPPPKPAMAVKPNVCNIYAAPTVATTRSAGKPPIASRPQVRTMIPTAGGSHEPQSGGSGCSSSEMSDKEELLGISIKLESFIDATKADMSKPNLLKLSNDLGSFAESASGFVDNVPATGRFRFRSLLNKLEQQSGELRSSSVGKSHHNPDIPAKLCGDIQATVRDLVSVIQR